MEVKWSHNFEKQLRSFDKKDILPSGIKKFKLSNMKNRQYRKFQLI
ncbi:hypothetical protein GMMP15_1050007 [Candidatus Magnetomoraceae bacterium gMMP-15]